MRKELKNNYRFVKNNAVCVNEDGVKKLKSLKRPAVEAFYLKSNLDRLVNMLNTNVVKMRKFNDANPCTQMQQLRNGQIEVPLESEMLSELKGLFPIPEVQQEIINTKSQILITALAWWGNKIRKDWKATFGHEPKGIFIDTLHPRMIA